MNDRLIELYKMSGRQDSFQLNNSNSSQDDDFMPQFSAKIKRHNSVQRIKDNTLRMQEMSEKYSRATTSYVEKVILISEIDQNYQENQNKLWCKINNLAINQKKL
ncbi:unnamed protein product [Paramecium sonneborni]|uniref:Uncharacterized protein n=1 Tax=Paramecium sonneborni TaxID=65129 RepID=A0A8S1K5K5_9CILI|nr:unnamed protein product [Paramecium sonneborni]